MEEDLYSDYTKFLEASGDVSTRMRIAGYPAIGIPQNTTINSYEDFENLVKHVKNVDKEALKKQINKCFKSYLKKKDILHILNLGDDKFSDKEINEAYRLMPVDEDGGILVDDLLDFLYN